MQKPNYLLRLATLSLLLSLIIPFYGMSQSASDAYISMANSQSATITGTWYIILTDTASVSQIETSLGSASGLTDLLNQTYNYDVTTGLPLGFTYSRQGNKLVLGICNITPSDSYYGSVRIKNSSGSWSAAFTFITN